MKDYEVYEAVAYGDMSPEEGADMLMRQRERRQIWGSVLFVGALTLALAMGYALLLIAITWL